MLAWVFPLQGLGVAAESLLRRELRFQWLANLDVSAYAIGYGLVGIALALAGWGVWALVAGQITQGLLRTGVLLIYRRPSLRQPFDLRAFRDLVYFGGGFTVARAANYVAVQGDNLVVGRFLGPQALGFYGRAYSLMSAPAYSFGNVLDQVLFPAMAKVQHDPQRQQRRNQEAAEDKEYVDADEAALQRGAAVIRENSEDRHRANPVESRTVTKPRRHRRASGVSLHSKKIGVTCGPY